jgi:hypothetical protein
MSCNSDVDISTETGIGHAFLGLFGLGELHDPMGKLRGELSSKVSEFNNTTAQLSLAAAISTSQTLKAFLKDSESQRDLSARQLNDLSTDTSNLFESANQNIKFLYLFVMVISMYLIFGT